VYFYESIIISPAFEAGLLTLELHCSIFTKLGTNFMPLEATLNS